jgi:hypothetical protein
MRFAMTRSNFEDSLHITFHMLVVTLSIVAHALFHGEVNARRMSFALLSVEAVASGSILTTPFGLPLLATCLPLLSCVACRDTVPSAPPMQVVTLAE